MMHRSLRSNQPLRHILKSAISLFHQQRFSSSSFTTKLSVDPISDSPGTSALIQRHSSDAALRKAAKISATLPKFGQKAKLDEKKKRSDEVRKRMQLLAEEEEFLNQTNVRLVPDETDSASKNNGGNNNSYNCYSSQKDLQKAEDDAWSRVSEKYQFATKPGYLPTYRAFLYDLQKYEINFKLASSKRLIFLMDIVKTNSSSSTSDSHDEALLPMEIIASFATDAEESHSMSTMLLWTKNVLEGLHFGAGAGELRRIGTALVPFSVPKIFSSARNDGNDDDEGVKNEKKKNNKEDHQDLDDVSTFRHSTNIGLEGFHQLREYEENSGRSQNTNNNNSSFCSSSHDLKFLKLECKLHPDTPNSILFPASSPNATLVSVGGQLARWAVVTVEREITSSTPQKTSYKSPWLLNENDDNDEKNIKNNNNNNNNNLLMTVSLQTWTYMMLSSMIVLLSRNDVGIPNHELVSTIHSAKDLEPLWHQLRMMSGMHAAPWPIDPKLLWYPGKR